MIIIIILERPNKMFKKAVNVIIAILVIYVIAGIVESNIRKNKEENLALSHKSGQIPLKDKKLAGGDGDDQVVTDNDEAIAVENQSKVVNVYSSRKEELMHDLFNKFEKENDIKINFITDKAGKLILKLENEGKNSPADLFLTSDIGNLQRAKEKGLLKKVSSDVLNENISDKFRDAEGYWYGLSKRVRAIFYRKGDESKIDITKIKNYEDLASEDLKGKVLIRSSGNIYNQSLLASIISANGRGEASNWVASLVENFARKPQGGDTDQLRALAAGEGELAVANSYYYGRLQASNNEKDREVASKIEILFPNQENRGAHVNISGGAVAAYAKNTDNALKLLEFLSSDEAQKAYAELNHEFPIKESVELSDIVKKWGNFKMDEDGLLSLSSHLSDATKIADEKGWR